MPGRCRPRRLVLMAAPMPTRPVVTGTLPTRVRGTAAVILAAETATSGSDRVRIAADYPLLTHECRLPGRVNKSTHSASATLDARWSNSLRPVGSPPWASLRVCLREWGSCVAHCSSGAAASWMTTPMNHNSIVFTCCWGDGWRLASCFYFFSVLPFLLAAPRFPTPPRRGDTCCRRNHPVRGRDGHATIRSSARSPSSPSSRSSLWLQYVSRPATATPGAPAGIA